MWSPKEIWKHGDIFIIGGGPSLGDFDWNLLRNEFTIGCNWAFSLGKEICTISHFCDIEFYREYKDSLSGFGGLIVTSHPSFIADPTSCPVWLKAMRRERFGLHHDSLGFNGNTGASAINLALLLGARRIFLLGFDMALGEQGNSNWHTHSVFEPKYEVYSRFKTGFDYVYRDWKKKFRNREIINLNENSGLTQFPKIARNAFFTTREN